MISNPNNRVQAIKSKFENLSVETEPLILRKKNIADGQQVCKQKEIIDTNEFKTKLNDSAEFDKENDSRFSRKHSYGSIETKKNDSNSDTSDDWSPMPNTSYLYGRNDVKRSLSDNKKSLTRQTSDPGKKLHRSHAFRCDRSQKIGHSPKRHGSCNGRSETSDFSLKAGDRKLSKERLKKLSNLLEDQMKKEGFVPSNINKMDAIKNNSKTSENAVPYNSVPDSEVPQHILDQYAKVSKPKKKDSDAMTDSGVSSETENVDDDKTSKIKKLMLQFEQPDAENVPESKTNLEVMNDLCISSETMRLERKNPHLILTDTLKKALKQPLPPGPPPKKPPRSFVISPIPETSEKKKKDTKQMLEKLEQVLQKREAEKRVKNIYDIAETNLTLNKPKEMHYLCTEILDITHKTLLSNQNMSDSIANCFNSLNCAITKNSTMSLPYTRFDTPNSNRNSMLCCSCSSDNLDSPKPHLSTFLSDKICTKCLTNSEKEENFKCHLHCKCRRSEFYVQDEPIYDVPFDNDCDIKTSSAKDKHLYGTLNTLDKNTSRSLEDIRISKDFEDNKIYDIPCDVSRPATPEFTSSPISVFERLRRNFETGFRETEPDKKPELTEKTVQNIQKTTKKLMEKPIPLTPKPMFIPKLKVSKSTENLSDDGKLGKRVERKFATETKRYRKHVEPLNIPKRDNQLEIDRENLNRLMNEIYETVTAVCNMDENKPGSFPTELSDGSTSEESVKLTRSLTEKRKNYVRRVSSRVAYLDPKNIKSTRFRHQTSVCSYNSEILDNSYSTFRSWKIFRSSQNNLSKMDRRESTDSKFNLTDSRGNILSMKDEFNSNETIDNLSMDEKTGCMGIELPFEPRNRLFNLCLLVGLNYMTGQAYVKSVFPSQVQVPPHIENLIFPETMSGADGGRGEWAAEARAAHCYSLVLTDERGERSYGYCRRVLPEGATSCLPLCYCLIGRYRAPGFYYKVLQEIESHHGSSEVQIHSILQQLFEAEFPHPGEEITITYTRKDEFKTTFRNSVNLGDVLKSKTMPDARRNKSDYSDHLTDSSDTDRLPDYYDLENNNNTKRVTLSLEGPRMKTLKRPLEWRADENCMCCLVETLGAGLVVKVFASLLLERKVVIAGESLSQVSSCMEALQASLYPLVWQQPLITTIPAAIRRDVLEAPLPILAGMLTGASTGASDFGGDALDDIQFEEGMLIDLSHPSKVLFYQGDESTILPTASYKSLKTSLQMESSRNKDRHTGDYRTRNVMISEAFLRFFVDILGDFWVYFRFGELKEEDMGKAGVVFDKEAFIKNASSKQNQYFLEWFTETAMFNHFVQNMALCYRARQPSSLQTINLDLVDTPLPNFYELFEDRQKSRTNSSKNIESKSNYKNAVNKKVKLLKTKLRDLVT